MDTNLSILAFELVEILFKNKIDKGGHSYIGHLTRVASSSSDDIDKAIRLLHDVIEDTDYTAIDLINYGFPTEVVTAVEIVSRKNSETYKEFIDRICDSNNTRAIRTKIADLNDNMDLSRIPNPTQRDYDRVLKRYMPAHKQLTQKLQKLEQN